MKHYFLFTSLPPLELHARPDIAYSVLLDSYLENLTADEKSKLAVIQLFIDLNNIYAYLTGGKWSSKGTISGEEMKEFLAKKEGLPEYVFDFFDEYEDLKDRQKFFSKVLVAFFHDNWDKYTGFLREFIHFERNLRLVLLAYRAKRAHTDLLKELQFEDLSEPLVVDILARKDAAHYDFPFEFRDLKLLVEAAGQNPLKQHFAILKYRFGYYAHFIDQDPFSLDSLLAYFVAHAILDDYYSLSVEEGKQFLDSILGRS